MIFWELQLLALVALEGGPGKQKSKMHRTIALSLIGHVYFKGFPSRFTGQKPIGTEGDSSEIYPFHLAPMVRVLIIDGLQWPTSRKPQATSKLLV